MERTKLIIGIFFIYLFICLMSTFYSAWFPALSKTQWLLIAAVVVSFFVNGELYRSKVFLCLVLYYIIITVNGLGGDVYFQNYSKCFYEVMVPLFAMNMFYLSLNMNNGSYVKMILGSLFVIFAIVAIGTLISSQVTPEIVRTLSVETDPEIFAPYYRLGVSNYLLPHAIPVLLPILIFALKSNARMSKKWFFYFFLLAFSLMLVFLSASSSAMLLSIFGVLLSLTSKKGRILVSVVFLPFIISTELQIGLLQILIDLFSGNELFNSFAEHLSAMVASIDDVGTTGALNSRSDVYEMTINSFLKNPFLGVNEGAGGHMAILDRLAYLGIIGFLPLALLYVYYFKSVLLYLSDKVKPYFSLCLIIGFIMMTLKNMINTEMNIVMFAIIPILSVYYDGNTGDERLID